MVPFTDVEPDGYTDEDVLVAMLLDKERKLPRASKW